MPLLKRKVFEKVNVPEYLRDDEEVFHCEVTNEIFRDYEEFCERITLINSMVWSCTMTGRNNLTYAEALQSEENARKSLSDFPLELRLPVLYLATKTKKTAFTEMAEDVWSFVKDRYFVGEIVEASFTENSWCESHVLQVMAPSPEKIKANNGKGITDRFDPPASLFRYEVEQVDSDDQDCSQVLIIEASQIRRKKSTYSREKNRLYLKQFSEQSENGVWRIKEDIVKSTNLTKVTFEQIFDGPLPDFSSSKKSVKKQETLIKYLTLSESSKKKSGVTEEEMKKRIEELRERTERSKVEKLEAAKQAKQKCREENIKVAAMMREWNKQKDDLELEDHKVLPIPTPVQTKIPAKYFGEALVVLEFFNSFSDIINAGKIFPDGVTIELLERALVEQEVNGPLTDFVKILLNALFNELSSALSKRNGVSLEVPLDEGTDSVTVAEAIKLATVASHWSESHHGVSLLYLPLDGLTLSEVLRLHLLSSGGQLNEYASQYHQRGGYTCQDDPGLMLRIHHPRVLKALAERHVAQLSIGDKLKVLNCLINQLLTYSTIRDIIDDRMEEVRKARTDLRVLISSERRRENELISQKMKLKREAKLHKDENPNEAESINTKYEADIAKITTENNKKVEKYRIEVKKLTEASFANQVLLGLDRAYRNYIFIDSIPALFVEDDEKYPGRCLDQVIYPQPELAAGENTLEYIRNLYSKNGFDDTNIDSSLMLKKNGSRQIDDISIVKEMFMCTANLNDCPIHSDSVNRTKWSFFYKTEDIELLTTNLNKRGLREGELRQVLEQIKDYLEERLEKCPIDKLNNSIESETEVSSKPRRPHYKNANLGFEAGTPIQEVLELTLCSYILDLEQQIWSGGLGRLPVTDRHSWRKCLENRNYDLDVLRMNQTNGVLDRIKNADNASNGSRSSTPTTEINGVRDPGRWLPHVDVDSEDSGLEEDSGTPSSIILDKKNAVTGLALALQAVAHSVEWKYLKKPLGHADYRKSKKQSNEQQDLLNQWSASLMTVTSFSQVLLHYSTFESCVALEKSALNARCFTCRRCTNDDKLLLCDGCNRGQHLYCAEPKLTEVPKGDWYCHRCEPPKPVEKVESRRTRKLFVDDDDETSEVNVIDEQNEEESEESTEEVESESDDASEKAESEPEVCEICRKGGQVLCCDSCPRMYHPECLEPPLKRVPRGAWICDACKHKATTNGAKRDRARRAEQRGTERVDEELPRNSARQARHRIHGFVRSLRRGSTDSSSDDDSSSSGQKNNNRQVRRSRRTEEVSDDLPLHNAPLQEMLADILKHEDAWPFIQPVTKRDVPDYFEVISHPMDFGTIKYKLNIGKYQYDAELMADAMLVFENCSTYNDSDAPVYKSGVRLLKFFKNRCKELGLGCPSGNAGLDDESNLPPQKKRKTR